jgi:hypothetical protein
MAGNSLGDHRMNTLFAGASNTATLVAKNGFTGVIGRTLNLMPGIGNGVTGNIAISDNSVKPTVIKLIVDTTANLAQAITDFPLLDFGNFFKTLNIGKVAPVGTVFGGTPADLTTVSYQFEGNLSGYELFKSSMCVRGAAIMSMEGYSFVNGIKTPLNLDLKFVRYNMNTSETQNLGFFNFVDQVITKDATQSIITLPEDMRHIPKEAAYLISKLPGGQKYFFNIAILGYVN